LPLKVSVLVRGVKQDGHPEAGPIALPSRPNPASSPETRQVLERLPDGDRRVCVVLVVLAMFLLLRCSCVILVFLP
jgi:hypothetical protein